ncbi:helix-turn-helix transcriptional regulator [uncultured Vagococcus sp.]|uniref:helix-turn-helix transcriptional regulator n=1 Tax=uncultured Vagococcus sp. TaxID=189676 RepID=UPI0028D69E15|nr:helix-turn-helix transcriptional regulator [uncultured Vagococcus sp.]
MESYISQNLKVLRKKKGITQQQMAGALFVTPQAVSKWERGESLPDISLVPKLAQLFDVSISTLWEESILDYPNSSLAQLNELTHSVVSDGLFKDVLAELEAVTDIKTIVIRFDFFLLLNDSQKEAIVSAVLRISGSDYVVEEFYYYLSSRQKEQVVLALLVAERYLALELLIPMMTKSVRTKALEITLAKEAVDFLEELLPFLNQSQKQLIIDYANQGGLDVSLLENYLTFFTEKQRQQLVLLEEDLDGCE